jgi:hypothetical protein
VARTLSEKGAEMTQTCCGNNHQALGLHYFALSQTAIVAQSLVVISAWVAGSLRTRATHCRPLSIGTATWAIRTVDTRQAVPDQWLSLNWAERIRNKELPFHYMNPNNVVISGALRMR